MKKILKLLAVICFPLFISSCGTDDDDFYYNDLYGRWYMTEYNSYDNHNVPINERVYNFSTNRWQIDSYDANGVLTGTTYSAKENASYWEFDDYYVWDYDGYSNSTVKSQYYVYTNPLQFVFGGTTYDVIRFTSTQLIVQFDVYTNGYYDGWDEFVFEYE